MVNSQLKVTSPQEQRQPPFAGFLAKRITDVILSVLVLVLLFPVLLLIVICIKLDSQGPALFRQRRIGLNGCFFEIYKFRTMFVGTPDIPTDQMLTRPSQVTRVGNFLRKTSLDELPQLLNVLKAEMSLVGPRPALYNQIELTAKRRALGILSFLPGISGYAQVTGRDELPDGKKIEADAWYCNNWSYWLDWQILLSTVAAVVSKRGAF